MEKKSGNTNGSLRAWWIAFWHSLLPFSAFRDANEGSFEQRIASYRHNRAQRQLLPYYIAKWMAFAAAMLVMTRLLSESMRLTQAGTADHLCAALACMSIGIGFALACVVITILFASYLYLCCVER